MSQSLDLSVYEGRSDRPFWLVVLLVTTTLAGLATASASSYGSIVVAQATVSIASVPTLTFQGTESNGSLASDGTLAVVVGLQVDNPSTRTLHLQVLAFSEWVEDGPAQRGLNESRRITDAQLPGANGTRYFFWVFGESTEVSETPISPRSSASYSFTYRISRTIDPGRFAALRNITDFWVSTTGTVGTASWIFWVRVILVIDGVPPASSPTAAPYLRTIGRIDREEGVNLAN